MTKGQWFLGLYSGAVTGMLAVIALHQVGNSTRQPTFDQITVHRINVVEPNGTLRMVITDHAQLPGIIVRGKEQAFARPQAGLIFGGRRNAKNEIEDSGGSLSFDKYGANQV